MIQTQYIKIIVDNQSNLLINTLRNEIRVLSDFFLWVGKKAVRGLHGFGPGSARRTAKWFFLMGRDDKKKEWVMIQERQSDTGRADKNLVSLPARYKDLRKNNKVWAVFN